MLFHAWRQRVVRRITSPIPFAVVAEVSSQRASDISGSGEDLTLTSYLFGPRGQWHRVCTSLRPSAQALLGGAHASGSFASNRSRDLRPRPNSFALIAGGGLDIAIDPALRDPRIGSGLLPHPVQPTVLNDRQNSLRLSAGVSPLRQRNNQELRYSPFSTAFDIRVFPVRYRSTVETSR